MSVRRIGKTLARRLPSPLVDLVTDAGEIRDPTQEEFGDACVLVEIEEARRLLDWRLSDGGRLDPAPVGGWALRLAAYDGRTELVRLLLKDGRVDPLMWRSSALKSAAANGHIEIVRLLLDDRRSDPTDGCSNALRLSAESGHTKIVHLLLDDGRSDPKIYGSWATLLVTANRYSEIVAMLEEAISARS